MMMGTASFIVSPLPSTASSCLSSRRSRSRLFPDTARRDAPPLHAASTTCKLRNPGGFQLPPTVPSSHEDMTRAIELLGNYTQCSRTMKGRSKAALVQLLGAEPPSRGVAQQWKYTLQQHLKRQTRHPPQRYYKRLRDPVEVAQQNTLRESLTSLDRSHFSRLFVTLERARKMLILQRPIPTYLSTRLSAQLGTLPDTPRAMRQLMRRLAAVQRDNVRARRMPAFFPVNDLDALATANRILGLYTGCARGRVGKSQVALLRHLLQDTPENHRIARQWKKAIVIAIRKRKRRDYVEAKRVVDDRKRLARRYKRLTRAFAADVTDLNSAHVYADDGCVLLHLLDDIYTAMQVYLRQVEAEAEEELKRQGEFPTAVVVPPPPSAPALHAKDGDAEHNGSRKKPNYLSRLKSLFSRIFSLR